MKSIRLFCLFILLPVYLFSQEWKTFADTSILFTAKYPANWTNKIKEGKRVFFTSPADNATDDFFENVNISVTTNAEFGTTVKIKDLFPAVTDQIKSSFNDFTDEGQRFFQWNKMDACEIIYSGLTKSDESTRIRIIQWFCFYKTRLYTVTFTSLASNTTHTATATKIMASILFRL
jgi:hypothetical protein